ncbi:MAG TPA: Spy/CpxP family protein refolding chaperone, partial [Smithella sp.]|nr:Spy/CpxP family protein refolding chaperone [Smithella sp.]
MKKTFDIVAVVIAIIFVIASVAIVSSAYAMQPAEKTGHHKEFCIKKYLNLSDKQIASMKELRNSFQNDTRDMRYDLKIKRIEMRKLFTDPKTDDAALLAKHKEISDLRQQLSDKKVQMKIQWRKILTPEQIMKLDKIHHKLHARWA